MSSKHSEWYSFSLQAHIARLFRLSTVFITCALAVHALQGT